MKYHLPVTVQKLNDHEYMARAELVRATAVGFSPDEAIENLREAIDEMILEFGEENVFKNVNTNVDYRMVEVGH